MYALFEHPKPCRRVAVPQDALLAGKAPIHMPPAALAQSAWARPGVGYAPAPVRVRWVDGLARGRHAQLVAALQPPARFQVAGTALAQVPEAMESVPAAPPGALDRQCMAALGIVFEAGMYAYGAFHCDSLADAITYAYLHRHTPNASASW